MPGLWWLLRIVVAIGGGVNVIGGGMADGVVDRGWVAEGIKEKDVRGWREELVQDRRMSGSASKSQFPWHLWGDGFFTQTMTHLHRVGADLQGSGQACMYTFQVHQSRFPQQETSLLSQTYTVLFIHSVCVGDLHFSSFPANPLVQPALVGGKRSPKLLPSASLGWEKGRNGSAHRCLLWLHNVLTT